MRGVDPLLQALLADVASDPCGSDSLPLMALTDYLAEQPPGPVTPGRVPGWLQKAWLRSRRGEPRGAWGGLDVPWMVLNDLEEWFTAEGRRLGQWWYLNHHGSTRVGGLLGFVSEPTGGLAVARAQANRLAARLRCVGVTLPEGAWGRDVVRVLLLPLPRSSEYSEHRSTESSVENYSEHIESSE
jgi:hypothetical protein